MREASTGTAGMLRIVDDLRAVMVAAVVYGPNRRGYAVLRLNPALLDAPDYDRVLSWARRELASGKRIARLLADELGGLA